LKLLVGQGLSVIFISHKLNEVLAVSDRVLVLRAGRLAGERTTSAATRRDLAELMVGREVVSPPVPPAVTGPALLTLEEVSTRRRAGAPPLDSVTLTLRGGEITGLAGVSGNGQSALAGLLSGMERPVSGRMTVQGRAVEKWSPALALAAGIGRIPEDRQAVGTIGDMSVTENVVSERYRSRRFSRHGLLDWNAARRFAESVIADYGVKCPSPEARVRLLSGGNIQKLILGRALDPLPAIILANQPTRGLDVGAVAYVHARLLEARARGAAILLISEDLEEILALSDRLLVISRGRLSPPSSRGELSVREIGELMAGHAEAAPHAA
jgi:simple sugar transport system ATP-binding protein